MENPLEAVFRLGSRFFILYLKICAIEQGKGLFIDETRSRSRVLNIKRRRENFARSFLTNQFQESNVTLLHCFKWSSGFIPPMGQVSPVFETLEKFYFSLVGIV